MVQAKPPCLSDFAVHLRNLLCHALLCGVVKKCCCARNRSYISRARAEHELKSKLMGNKYSRLYRARANVYGLKKSSSDLLGDRGAVLWSDSKSGALLRPS